MADPAHWEVLQQGVETWNRWRDENPKIVPDLTRIDLSPGRSELPNLWDADWNKPSLEGANLRKAKIAHANFENAILNHCDLSFSDLERSNFKGASIGFASLRGANLLLTDLSEAEFYRSDLTGAYFHGTDLSRANLTEVKYRKAKLFKRGAGAHGLDSAWGRPSLIRDLRDQDYIDEKIKEWTDPPWNPKRFLLLWPWSWLDYGRSISRVLFIAALIVTAFGFVIDQMINSGQLAYTGGQGVINGFTPYYASGITFSTLGFTGLIEAQSLSGQIVLVIEVLLGYLTLGLLLAILANSVARRA